MNIYLLTLIIYGIGLVLLGLYLSRSVRRSRTFFVADRRLGPGLIFATVLAANIGAGSTVGAAGLGYTLGLSAWWWVGSAGIGSLVLAFTVGPKIRKLAARHDFLTVGDFLEQRYGVSVRASIAVILWFGTLAILAGQLIAFARILEVVAGSSKAVGCLIGGVVVLVYFTAGGLKGSARINLVQLCVKGVGFLLAIPYTAAAVGGWSGLEARLVQNGHGPDFVSITGLGWSHVLPYVVLLAPSFIVSPGLLQKIYGARDDRAVHIGVGANGFVLFLFSFIPVGLGMAAAALYPQLKAGELALPTVITLVLPTWLGALLLASVFSAEISSADAILFMLSTSLTRDLYQRFFRPDMDDRQVLRAGRILALLSGLAGIGVAMMLETVIDALSIFYSLLSASLFVPVFVGLYRAAPGVRTCLTSILAAIAATLATSLATGGAGWGPLSPTAVGIVVSALLFLVAFRRNGTPRME